MELNVLEMANCAEGEVFTSLASNYQCKGRKEKFNGSK